jgi:hypothetical protein
MAAKWSGGRVDGEVWRGVLRRVEEEIDNQWRRRRTWR